MTKPVAYLRRSSPDQRNGAGDVSREQQTVAVHQLAADDGFAADALLLLDADWGKSGRDAKIAERKDWARLLGMVERGEVSHVYAYEMDRLGRSVLQTARLAILARDAGTVIRCSRGISPDYSTPEGEMMTNTLSNIHQYYGSKASERARANVATRRERGDYLGVVPFGWQRIDGKLAPNPAEDVGAVHAAYLQAGSFMGAAQLLNERKVPSRRGKWADQTVARILRREGLIPAGGDGRPRSHVEHYLWRLLKCPHCGTLLTPQRKHGRADWTVYFCGNARRDKSHPRPYAVSESKLLDWVKAEASRFMVPERVALGDPSARRDELEEDRRRAGVAYAARAMGDEEFTTTIGRLDAELDALGAAEMVVDVPQAIDWETWDRGAVNGVLRAWWEHIVLGADMRPVEAVWRVPLWRRA